jgi:hypothetical protein
MQKHQPRMQNMHRTQLSQTLLQQTAHLLTCKSAAANNNQQRNMMLL